MTKVYAMNGYIEKMASPDQDFRYMALNDIMNDLKQDPNSFVGDEAVETKVLQNVLALVEDKISEVKNQAVKCLGQLMKVARDNQMETILDKLIELSGKSDEETRDIAGLALKTITSELPQSSRLATNLCLKLVPKLLVQLTKSNTTPTSLIDILGILSILITRFPSWLGNPAIKPTPISVLTPLLEHERPAVQKRAITTLAQSLPPSPPEVFTALISSTVVPWLTSKVPGVRRVNVQLIAAIARYTPQKLSKTLDDITPGVLKLATYDDPELREGCLQALETLVYRCPGDIAPHLSSIIALANHLIKYDPNYAEDDDVDDDAEMADPDDDSDEGLDDYSDDEDTSYKVRRSATKVLAAVIGTRPELLQTLYKDVSPVLISRFGDREDSVKLEIWGTYIQLLKQTRVYGDNDRFKDAEATSPLKRKREEDDGMDLDSPPFLLLRSQVSALSKQIFLQLKGSKVPPQVLQRGFILLIELLEVLPGALASQCSQLMTIAKSVLQSNVSTAAAPLHITVLSFLTIYFQTHSPSSFNPSISTINPTLLACLRQRHPRISSGAFKVLTSLLVSSKPVRSAAWVDEIYEEAVARLRMNDTDGTVRQAAEQCIGELWVSAPDIMRAKNGQEWEVILRSTERTENPIAVIIHVAQDSDVSQQWIDGCINWVLGVLRKSGRVGKSEAFRCLEVLLNKCHDNIPEALPLALLPLLLPYLATGDIALLSHSFSVLTMLLQRAPSTSYPYIESHLLKEIYRISLSPLISGTALDALLGFYEALVLADQHIATKIIPSLVLEVENTNKQHAAPTNIAKCIGAVVHANLTIARGTVTEFTKIMKNNKSEELTLVLSLLTLGEVGRFISMVDQRHIFDSVVARFSSDSEDVRSAAAFSAGNIAIGDMKVFLPEITNMIQSDAKRRLLALHALKEVVAHSSGPQLETFAGGLWDPLFEISISSEEASRNVTASCLGKLTTTKPSKYLPLLQTRLHDPSSAIRTTVLSALRYTLADTAPSYDELLAPAIVKFLSLMSDEDLNVQQFALQALNSAARNKPHLIRDHLASLTPQLYEATDMKPDLIEIVQMGPWQHKVDRGLEVRKAAYETMYTLLDTCLPKIDLHAYLARVLSGLKDDSDEIKVICHMMLFRMSQIAPAATAQRLDEVAEPLAATMRGVSVGKDTVKQDLERASELQRSAVRAISALSKISTVGVAPHFDSVVEQTRSGTYGQEFRDLMV